MAKWFLYDSNTGERVTQFPVTRPDFRGDQVTVIGGAPPLHRASSGRIWTDEGREFYPSVVDLEWRDDDAGSNLLMEWSKIIVKDDDKSA
jgi:hypothetical protein